MALRDDYPQLFSHSSDRTNPYWTQSATLSDPVTVRFLLDQIDAAESEEGAVDPYLRCVTLRDEVLRQKQCEEDELGPTICDFLNLYVCIPAIGSAIHSGQLGVAYDWLVYSLSDLRETGIQREIEPSRISVFLMISERLGLRAIGPVLLEWSGFFFYFARVRSVFHDGCDYLLPIVTQLLDRCLSDRNDHAAVDCLIHVACWSVHFSDSGNEIVVRLEQLIDDEHLSQQLRARIGIALTTSLGERSSRACSDWAKHVLKHYRDQLRGHEECQILCASVNTLECAQRLRPDIVRAAIEHARYVFSHTSSPSEARYGFARLFDVLTPVVSRICRHRDGDYLAELVCAWYGVDDPARLDDLLFVFCDDQVTAWFTKKHQIEASRQRQAGDSLAAVTRAMNAFLGTTNTVQGDRGFMLTAPTRPGVPVEENAQQFLESVEAMFALRDPLLRQTSLEGAGAIVLIPHLMAPLQTALLNAAGWTLPLSASLRRPLEDREVASVLLWPGGTFVDEIELGSVRQVLESAGVDVETVDANDRTKQQFLKLYSSNKHDIIWITAHTEYDHFSPHLSYITLDSVAEEIVTIRELERIQVPGPQRRLLVLNVCDGATGAVLGGTLGLGVAHFLAQPSQAVVSHMWPVGQRIAPLFGALLARELTVRDAAFFEAYSRTIVLLNNEKNVILQSLQESGSIFERLREYVKNRGIDPKSVYFWGSPVFME